MKKFLIAAVVVLSMAIAAPAFAADPATSGSATIANGVATLTSDLSDTNSANDYGALSFTLPAGTTLSSLRMLSADYNIVEGSCGGGSPRFQLNIDGKNVFVYLGPTPNFTGCATGWTSTGNLATNTELRVDLSQLGGSQYSTWAQAVALLGSRVVTGIDFAVDGGWALTGKKQVVQVRNVVINGTTYLAQATKTVASVNAAKLCKTQRAAMGAAAFGELWGTNANDRNAYGKCVSAANKAKNSGQLQQQILNASKACKAQGLKGSALGSCVAATDRCAETHTEAQEAAEAAHGKGKHKGKGK